MTPAEVAAVIGSVKSTRDLIASLKESAEKRRLLAQFDELYDKIFSLRGFLDETREALAAAKERAADLEKQCMALKDWTDEAKTYAIHELAPGLFAYTRKPGMETGEPVHSLCANCFDKGEKSILQRDYHPLGSAYRCQRCGANFTVKSAGRRF